MLPAKKNLIIFCCVTLLCACSYTQQKKVHHVEINVIAGEASVLGFDVVKFDSKGNIIDSVFYMGSFLDTAVVARAMNGVPKSTPIVIKVRE